MKRHNLKKQLLLAFLVFQSIFAARASYLFIPMDMEQSNHLKAYGIAYYAVAHQIDMSWLLNYRGGSFMCVYNSDVENEESMLVVRVVLPIQLLSHQECVELVEYKLVKDSQTQLLHQNTT